MKVTVAGISKVELSHLQRCLSHELWFCRNEVVLIAHDVLEQHVAKCHAKGSDVVDCPACGAALIQTLVDVRLMELG